ncbi:conjugal transfer protein [Streptomyces sp. NPDC046859]|uniref:conjugal transfer protein n=1 Tax=Streptomyces sp. NPDC046859 TaxID=3155734 RepID=UPI0033E5A439
MSPGKQTTAGEGAAAMAAGARLEAMRRRVHLSRLALWTAIAAGPAALAVAVASTPTTVEAAPAARPTAVHTAAANADPAGYAQLFLSAWLRASADDATTAQSRLAQSMAPDVELPDPAAGAQSSPTSVTAVRSAQRGHGVWSVTVAVQYAGGRLRHYTVPVAVGASGAAFTVTGAPGVVPGPGRVAVPKSPYGVRVPEGALSSGVGEFFAAYLTDAGEVDRYLAPGVQIPALSPAPYTAVSVEQVSAVEEAAAADQVPADGTAVRVLVRVEAQDAGGQWPLAYELMLKARSGRWEVAALDSRAAQDGSPR